MTHTTATKSISEKGVLVIPKKIRNQSKINSNYVQIVSEPGRIVITGSKKPSEKYYGILAHKKSNYAKRLKEEAAIEKKREATLKRKK